MQAFDSGSVNVAHVPVPSHPPMHPCFAPYLTMNADLIITVGRDIRYVRQFQPRSFGLNLRDVLPAPLLLPKENQSQQRR